MLNNNRWKPWFSTLIFIPCGKLCTHTQSVCIWANVVTLLYLVCISFILLHSLSVKANETCGIAQESIESLIISLVGFKNCSFWRDWEILHIMIKTGYKFFQISMMLVLWELNWTDLLKRRDQEKNFIFTERSLLTLKADEDWMRSWKQYPCVYDIFIRRNSICHQRKWVFCSQSFCKLYYLHLPVSYIK